jgi:hypothetical protein
VLLLAACRCKLVADGCVLLPLAASCCYYRPVVIPIHRPVVIPIHRAVVIPSAATDRDHPERRLRLPVTRFCARNAAIPIQLAMTPATAATY